MKMLAYSNRILVLRRVEQWQALRETIAAYRSLFPQTATDSGSDTLRQIAQEAETKLAE